MTALPRITTEQRRRRLVDRHHLDRSAANVVEAIGGLVAQHSSDPITPVLAMWARVPAFTTGDLDEALYETKTLWRLHAMRRTLFVVDRELGPAALAAASADVARKERRRLVQWLSDELPAAAVPGWLDALEEAVCAALSDGDVKLTKSLSGQIEDLATPVTLGSGKWSQRSPIGSRLLLLMAMDGLLVRAQPAGSWRSGQYRWAAADQWFGPIERWSKPRASAEILRCYLAAYGPASLTDVRWWTGWTVKQTRRALAAVGAVRVELEAGAEALVLPEDVHDGAATQTPAAAALLPGLDSTPMGWKERDWFLGEHQPALFDRNGNVGPTVWWRGRIVGGWAQRANGEVVYRLLEDVGADAARRIESEAAALTLWLGDIVVKPRFRTPLEKQLSGT